MQHQVQQRVVERRQAELRNECQQARRGDDDQRRALHEPFPGRSTRMKISSVNDTIGAHDGAVTAIVIASLTPISVPAISGPSARPRPPSITAANTTPIHAYICDGASVKLKARQT